MRFMLRGLVLAASVLACLSGEALAQATFTAKDASSVTQTFKSFNCASQICALNVPADATGAAFGVTANPFFVAPGTGQTFPISAASLPLPSGAATAAGLTTINATLGSPFQAGGSIGNTAFGISGTLPAFAAIPTFKVDQTTPGTTNKVSIGTDGTVNPQTPANWAIGAFGSGMPANGVGIGLFDGANMVRAPGDETNGLFVQVPNAGAFVDGWDATLGSTGDTAWSGSGSASGISILKGIYAAAKSGTGSFGSAMSTSGVAVGLFDGTNMIRPKGDETLGAWANLKGVGGTAVDTNSGNKSAGTQRFVLATDQPTMTNPQPVTPQATESHLGEVGGNQIRVDVAQTVTASAYSAGNAVGGLMTIAGAARVSGSLGASGTGGILQQVVMNSKSVQTAQMDVFIFNSNPTSSTCTDKTAFVLATADFDKVVGVASIPGAPANNSGWFSGGTGSVGQANNLAMAFDLSSATSLYACAVTRGTPTFAATSDISLKYQILRD
jgi:hypothetical protein